MKDGLEFGKMTTHFKDILNISRTIDENVLAELLTITTVADLSPPTTGEVAKARKRLKSNKASGLSGVPTECITDITLVAEILHKHISEMWNDDENSAVEIPAQWLESILKPLYEKKTLIRWIIGEELFQLKWCPKL